MRVSRVARRRRWWEARGWRAPPTSLFPHRMRWQSLTASLVLPIPSELIHTQDEDGRIPPPISSSSHSPMLEEAVGLSMVRIPGGDVVPWMSGGLEEL